MLPEDLIISNDIVLNNMYSRIMDTTHRIEDPNSRNIVRCLFKF